MEISLRYERLRKYQFEAARKKESNGHQFKTLVFIQFAAVGRCAINKNER